MSPRLTVIGNPTKVDDLDAVRTTLADACARHGWAVPDVVETTEDDPGEGQARAAAASGADVVASLGGDGTVRAVAAGLLDTEAALGLLPGGTGNLLARNLGLPTTSLEDAVEALLTGAERPLDVGMVDDGAGEQAFLVMAGLGLDGEVMADTDERLKGVVGWLAYVVAAGKHLFDRGFRVVVDADGAPNSAHQHARTVVVGNCGSLQGGIELLQGAEVDDGLLDVIVVAPHGLRGWGAVLLDIATRHRAGHRRLRRLQTTALRIAASRPVQAQIDGDPIGERSRLSVRVLPGALQVRC